MADDPIYHGALDTIETRLADVDRILAVLREERVRLVDARAALARLIGGLERPVGRPKLEVAVAPGESTPAAAQRLGVSASTVNRRRREAARVEEELEVVWNGGEGLTSH